MEKYTGSSNGCFREVDIFDTYVVKRPKKNYTDGGPEEYFFERRTTDKCLSCPFKHLCDDLVWGNYVNNEDFFSKFNELEENCPDCDLFSYYEDVNEDYIDEEECSRCNIVEFNIWERLEGHRGGLCDIFDYDEFSEELIMKKAKIAGDIFSPAEFYDKAHAVSLPQKYNKKTYKHEYNKIIYKQSGNNRTRLTKKQKKQIEKFRRLLNKHPELTEFKNIIIFAIVTNLNYKPLMDTVIHAAKKGIYFNDMHTQNWGLIGNRIVIIDYAGA